MSSLPPTHDPASHDLLIQPERVFALIDRVLPFDICLYHQVLPLDLEGNCLSLGLVCPEDTASLHYVESILAPLNYHPRCQAISAKAQQQLLSAFLEFDRRLKAAGRDRPQSPEKVAEAAQDFNFDLAKVIDPALKFAPGLTPAPDPNPAAPSPDSPPDNPPTTNSEDNREVVFELDLDLATWQAVAEAAPVSVDLSPVDDSFDPADTPSEIVRRETVLSDPSLAPRPASEAVRHQTNNAVGRAISDLAARAADSAPDEVDYRRTASDNFMSPLPEISPLVLRAPFADLPLGQLAALLGELSPRPLAHELLHRAISQGIGRIYIERASATSCRILCSQDGLLQAALENLPPALVQGTINELKLIVDLPLTPTEKTKQVEVERVYEGESLLLRLRVAPGQHGEEATLQVLRGAALKFHQRQHVSKIGADALSLARQLHKQVAELRATSLAARASDAGDPPAIVGLAELRQLLALLQAQLADL